MAVLLSLPPPPFLYRCVWLSLSQKCKQSIQGLSHRLLVFSDIAGWSTWGIMFGILGLNYVWSSRRDFLSSRCSNGSCFWFQVWLWMLFLPSHATVSLLRAKRQWWKSFIEILPNLALIYHVPVFLCSYRNVSDFYGIIAHVFLHSHIIDESM
jgi:hypothetical protein